MFRLLLDSNTCILQPNAISGEIASSGFRFYINGQNEQTLMMKGGKKRRKEMNIINDETNPSKARFTAGTTRNIDQDQIDFLT